MLAPLARRVLCGLPGAFGAAVGSVVGNPVRADYTSSVVPRYLNNRAASIFGGSQEVQRNIIAKLVLQL